ncbi:hypothetical protein ACVBE9_06795 [Eionea flava]
MLNTPLGKTIVIALSICLAAVVGMFLYTDNSSSNDEPLNTVATPSQSAPSQAADNVSTTSDTANAESTIGNDKSLPIPARQLKKLIADTPKDDALEQQIKQANQAIAELEESLPEELKAANAQADSSDTSDESDQQIQEIQERLKHLRDHIDKKNSETTQ